MVTRAEVEELWQAYEIARSALNNSEPFQRMEDLHRRYSRARAEVEAQEKIEKTQAKAKVKATFKAELAAAKNKRPLRELVADKTVVGTFRDWRFGTKTGIELELFKYVAPPSKAGEPSLAGATTWEELRDHIDIQGGWPRFCFRKKWTEVFTAIRSSDQTWQSFPVDNVVAWKAGGNDD